MQAYDGGLADEPFHEPHAGYTFCSLGALALVGRLNTTALRKPDGHDVNALTAPSDPEGVLGWLVSRQTELTDPDAGLDTEFQTAEAAPDKQHAEGMHVSRDTKPPRQDPDASTGATMFDLLVDGAGMNGRTNKVADTCYAFWVGASLHIMEMPSLCDQPAIRRYLLGKTQHEVLGGFGKFPGDLPDLYHSYLGLAALSLAGSDQIKALDGGMCLSTEARQRLPELWKSWEADG